ncbi:hypothetical protein [Oryzifoliimicrobium ureilyticus]|uniref:hypothetical protein n=1 Tax=Oryzifoliimicrobium ureilyticus TaxID=3113724 RepID=UPI0030762885
MTALLPMMNMKTVTSSSDLLIRYAASFCPRREDQERLVLRTINTFCDSVESDPALPVEKALFRTMHRIVQADTKSR